MCKLWCWGILFVAIRAVGVQYLRGSVLQLVFDCIDGLGALLGYLDVLALSKLFLLLPLTEEKYATRLWCLLIIPRDG